jgi:sugar/nucleoside kinase (ribokinase family)
MLIIPGSIYLEYIYSTDKLPCENQVCFANDVVIVPGGKAMVQSLAAARWEVRTALVGRIGSDVLSRQLITRVRRQGIMTSGVAASEHLTGMMVNILDETGKYSSIIHQGANSDVSADQVPEEILGPGNILLMQTELDPSVMLEMLEKGRACGATTMLDLSSGPVINPEKCNHVDYIFLGSVNARHFADLCGIKTPENDNEIAEALSAARDLTCIIIGNAGSCVTVSSAGKTWCVDTRRDNEEPESQLWQDCFCGIFAACIHERETLETSLRKASTAAVLCRGGDPFEGLPYKQLIEETVTA